jgi:MFS transporter, PAT family, beta-lactamase induction signal transducer AmpG
VYLSPVYCARVTKTVGRRSKYLVFSLLDVPFGLSSGYVAVALGWYARQVDVSVGDAVALTSATTLPHIIKFLWAPVVDYTLSRKTWYWIGTAISAFAYLALTMIPIKENLGLLTGVVVAQSVGAALLGMAIEGIMAYSTDQTEKGKAAGWFQAGNLGGAAIGGGLGLYLLRVLPEPWMAGAAMAALTLSCGFFLAFVQNVYPAAGGKLGDAIRLSLRDLREMMSSARGIVGTIMFLLPIGTGSLQGVFSTVAREWNASPSMVELVNGWVGAPIVILGCIAGGALSDRMSRAYAYVVTSLFMAAVTIGMAVAPLTPTMYAVFVLSYTVAAGLTYGTYGGFVLDAAGHGAVATKYNILASFANAPIYYLARIDGEAFDRWGARPMLWLDAALGIAGCILVSLLIVVLRRWRRDPVAAV